MEHRTTSHAYTVRMKKKNMTVTIIVVLLTIVLLAGIVVLSPLGDYLTEHLFQPTISALKKSDSDQSIVSALKNQEQTTTASATAYPSATPVQNQLTVVETPFYILQMGTFTEVEDAQSHAMKLRAMGAAGYVYQDGAVYRVFAAAYQDQNSLEIVQSQVRTDGFEATPYITDQKSVHLNLKGSQEAVYTTEAAIQQLAEIPSELCQLSLDFDKGTLIGEQVEERLLSLSNETEDMIRKFDSIDHDSIDILVTALEKYQNYISTFLKDHDTISKMNAGDLKLLQLQCIINYIQFFERR